MIKSPSDSSLKRLLKRNRWLPTKRRHLAPVQSVPQVVAGTGTMIVNNLISQGTVYTSSNQLSHLYVGNFTFSNDVISPNVIFTNSANAPYLGKPTEPDIPEEEE